MGRETSFISNEAGTWEECFWQSKQVLAVMKAWKNSTKFKANLMI